MISRHLVKVTLIIIFSGGGLQADRLIPTRPIMVCPATFLASAIGDSTKKAAVHAKMSPAEIYTTRYPQGLSGAGHFASSSNLSAVGRNTPFSYDVAAIRRGSANVTAVDTPIPTPQEPYAVEKFSIANSRGIDLAGTLFRVPGSDIAVVFAHSFVPGEDQTGLYPLANQLARRGISVLTFDFPGYGASKGPAAYDEVDRDVATMIIYLKGLGYGKIASLGVGLGGLGSVKNGHELMGLITISVPTSAMGALWVTRQDLGRPYPKLFISSEQDFANMRPFAAYAKTIHDSAVAPKELKIFSGNQHSMRLFDSEHDTELTRIIVDFFEALRDQ